MTAAKKAAPKPKPEPEPVEAEPIEAPADRPAEPELVDVTLGDLIVQAYADARDDFEVLDDVQMLMDGNLTRLPALLRRLVPEKDRRALLDKARGKNGRVSIDAASDLIWDLFAGMRNPN